MSGVFATEEADGIMYQGKEIAKFVVETEGQTRSHEQEKVPKTA